MPQHGLPGSPLSAAAPEVTHLRHAILRSPGPRSPAATPEDNAAAGFTRHPQVEGRAAQGEPVARTRTVLQGFPGHGLGVWGHLQVTACKGAPKTRGQALALLPVPRRPHG